MATLEVLIAEQRELIKGIEGKALDSNVRLLELLDQLAQQALLVSDEARLYSENIVETVRGSLLVLDDNLKIISANRNFYNTFQVTPENTIGCFIYNLGNRQWDIPRLKELLEEILPKKESFDEFEVDHYFQDIGQKVMLLNARQIFRKDIGSKRILLAIEDITDRKKLEALLVDSEEKYKRLFETASDGIILLEKIKGTIVHLNPAALNLVGYPSIDCIGKTLQDIGIPLDMENFSKIIRMLSDNGIINYQDIIIKPKIGEDIFADVYLVDRARLLQCNIRDITARKKTEGEITLTHNQLENALYATVDALASAVEAKDPYTAGHHQRVSQLSGAIAREMGCSAEKIKLVQTAAIIHDVGKIQIPTEILVKPGKISTVEFDLIKTHVICSYDLLKNIDFPWPIAEIVYQHHERIDGSGYPRGLKADQMMIEAKIICVADVVEAMSSHRPYGPALGIDSALFEIDKNKAILYDTKVVEACLRLFKEKDYHLIMVDQAPEQIPPDWKER